MAARTVPAPEARVPYRGPLREDSAVDARTRLTQMRAVERLAVRDASLFADPAVAADRLGWIGLPTRAADQAASLAAFGEDVASSGITDVVLLGMGGSSLAPLVLSRVFGH